MLTQHPKHVFISYVRENKDQVDRLESDLEKAGVEVWIDRHSIKPGARWRQAIQEAIRQGDFFIACFSKEYTSKVKTHMNEELTLAIEELRQYASQREWFIPVLFSECEVPARSIGAGETLLDINWVPIYEDWEGGVKKILNVINPIPAEVQMHIAALRSADPFVRLTAAGELGRIGDNRAVPSLIEALNDSDMHVRADVARALSLISDPRAVPALIRALVDKEYYKVGMQAQAALINIGKEAIPSLEQAASQDENRAIQNAAKDLLRVMKPRQRPD